MEATPSRADTSLSRAPVRQAAHRAHAASGQAGLAGQADAPDNRPGFAQLLGERIGKATDPSAGTDDASLSDAEQSEADVQDKLASPAAEGTAAWWVERSRMVANDPAQRAIRQATTDREESTGGSVTASTASLARRAGTPPAGPDAAADEPSRDKQADKATRRDGADTADTGAIRLPEPFLPASSDPIDPALLAPNEQPLAPESTDSAPGGSASRDGAVATEAPGLDALAAALPLPAPEATRLATASSAFNPLPTREIRPSPGTPAFAPALGHEVRLLVRDGVQEARLQLNPVDMGPVTVKIALEGNTARVDFVADAQATRDAIESAMSQLAQALNESGLAFKGGDVSSQARDSSREGGDPAGRGAQAAHRSVRLGRETDPLAGAAAPATHARRGAVDLYA